MDEAGLANKFIVFVMFGLLLLALAMGNARADAKADIVVDGVPYAIEKGIAINLSETEIIEEIKDGVDDHAESDGEAQPESL